MNSFGTIFKVYKISFVVVIAMIIIATIAQALFPVFAGQTVTELANLVIAYQNGNPDMVWQSLLGLLVNLAYVLIVLVVSSLIYMVLMSRIIAESTNEMRKGLFGKLSRLTVSFFDRHQDGDILSRFTSDLDNILQAFNESLVSVMTNIALYIGLLIVMFAKNVTLALITIASTPIAVIMLIVILKLARNIPISSKKRLGSSMLIWMRVFQVKKPLLFRVFKMMWLQVLLSKMNGFEKQPLRAECFQEFSFLS